MTTTWTLRDDQGREIHRGDIIETMAGTMTVIGIAPPCHDYRDGAIAVDTWIYDPVICSLHFHQG